MELDWSVYYFSVSVSVPPSTVFSSSQQHLSATVSVCEKGGSSPLSVNPVGGH